MSGSDSVSPKSPRSVLLEEENQIRIDEISLPPDMMKESVDMVVCDDGPKKNLGISDKLVENRIKSINFANISVPKNYESSLKSCKQSIKLINQNNDDITYKSIDNNPESISDISLPDSVTSDSTFSSKRALKLSSQSDKNVSPCKILLSNSSKFQENFLEPLPQTDTKNYVSNAATASHSDSTTSLTTFDIPLPDQNLDFIYPPLPLCGSKVHSDLKFHDTTSNKKTETKNGTNDSQLDCSLRNKFKINLNLESDKSNSENCVFGTMKTCGDVLINSDNLPTEFFEGTSALELDEKKKCDDSRYSPSKVDSDEENQDFMTIKPKVLGKEQAKKRLMAFSLSKQPSTVTLKRQNKLVAVNKTTKEKPPNPNKSAGVQDQFRATITAIEEEKKKIMQNMPNYLYPFTNNLSQITDTVIPISAQYIDKSNKDEMIDSDSSTKNPHDKDGKDINRNKYDRISSDKTKRSRQRNSKSRRVGNGTRDGRHPKEKEEKFDRKEFTGLFKKMEMLNNWKTFVSSGFVLSSEFRRLKIHFDAEKQKQKDRRRSRSPEGRLDYKPVFNYLKKEAKIMAPLQAKSSYSGALVAVPFQEKKVKFTRTKPIITWSENPAHATDFFMSKEMLLENCDSAASSLLLYIIEQRKEMETSEVPTTQKERTWYPQCNHFMESPKCDVRETLESQGKHNSDTLEIQERKQFREDKKNKSEEIEEKVISNKPNKKQETCEMMKNLFIELEKPSLHDNEVGDENISNRKPRRRRMSLVNDEYSSEVESEKLSLKEMIINDVKLQVDIGLNSVKVKSKWDSDYEGEEIERNILNNSSKEEDMEIATPEDQTEAADAVAKNEISMDIKSVNTFKSLNNFSEFNKEEVYNQGNKLISMYRPQYTGNELEGSKGTLVSQYEEFMKMVASEVDNSKNLCSNENSEEKAKYEIRNSSASGKIASDGIGKKIQTTTDWDQESDREEKSSTNKIKYVKEDTADSFSILPSGYDAKKRRDSNSPVKKKTSKMKSKSIIKKLSQMRKLKSKELSSSDSSTDSSDSDSESSDSEDEKWKRKKRKLKKMKKKFYSSASDSESLSDVKIKRGKLKRKKSKSKRRKSRDDSHGDEEITGAVLKQLDFKKQQIIKKIEEIDSINVRESKKNEKKKMLKIGKEESSESEESETQEKAEKQRRKKFKSSNKSDRMKFKSKDDIENLRSQKKLTKSYISTDSESPSESEDDNLRRKRSKNKSRKSKSSSESSSDKKSRPNRKSRKLKKNFKSGKKKRLECSSSSESDSDGSSRKVKKKLKKKKKRKKNEEKYDKYSARKMHGWNEHLLSEEPEFKTGNSVSENMGDEMPWINEIQWKRGRKSLMACGRETKTLVDWEESSREESPEERSGSSSWDEEAKQSCAPKYPHDQELKDNAKRDVDDKTNFLRKEAIIDENNEFMNDFNLETKPRLIINENSLSNLIRGAKIDIYPLANGANSSAVQHFNKDNIDSLDKGNAELNMSNGQTKRNFLDVVIDRSKNEEGKSSKQEVYSPGHTDSDLSDDNIKEESKDDSFRKRDKQDIYDPLNADSDASVECGKVEVTNIPLPSLTDILLPGEMKEEREKEKIRKPEISSDSFPIVSSSVSEKPEEKLKSDFISLPFATDAGRKNEIVESASNRVKPQAAAGEKRTISVRLQQKFQCKVASVFQSDSEEEVEPVELNKRGKTVMTIGEKLTNWKVKMPFFNEESEKPRIIELSESQKTEATDSKRHKNRKKREESRHRERRRERSKEKDDRTRGNVTEANSLYKEYDKKYSPKHVGQSPDSKFLTEERDEESKKKKVDDLTKSVIVPIDENHKMSDSENGVADRDDKADRESSKTLEDDSDVVRPIPVLTGVDVRGANQLSWGRSHMTDSEDINYSCDRFDLMGPESDAFKIYESTDEKSDQFLIFNMHDNKFIDSRYGRNYEVQGNEGTSAADADALTESRTRKEKRKSRSRSFSPKKRRSPDRRRSPRNRSHSSVSPRRKGKSPFSPRRRSSPRKKSPCRKYRSSRSPERRKSRSPRKRRHSPSRRSRSISPKKHKSPKRRLDSPGRHSLSPRQSSSPRNEKVYSVREIGIIRNLIPIARSSEDNDMDLSPLAATQSPRYDSPMGFTRSLADSTISDSELNNNFYNRDYPGEFGRQNYSKEITVNNLITLQSHDADKRVDSPKRLTLDQRIEMELSVPIGLASAQGDQYQVPQQSYQQYPDVPNNQYQNSYSCDNIPHSNSNGSQSFYSNQMNSDFNSQYFNGQASSSNYSQFHQYQRHNSQSMQNSVLQVGNIMEVVPTLQAPPPPPPPLPSAKDHQIMQVGNVLQVVPSAKPTQGAAHNYGVPQSLPPSAAPLSPGKTQKGPLATQDPPIIPQNPELLLNPLIKAIQAEREKRRKEREKRRAERDARRKARQLRREAKLMSVNEKLKKSVQDEGLMLGQDLEEDELLEDVGHVSPPIPVEIITDATQNSQPPAGKGILITAGFIPKPSSEKKEVKFADGVCPGEGTSTSEGEDQVSTPPKPKLPKEKRYKKKKTKLKKKVKVHIIRQVIQDVEEEEEEDDDLSPPPPPPGDPPPVFFARFPFGSKAQYPVYQTQTTTTTLTTVQFPTQSFSN